MQSAFNEVMRRTLMGILAAGGNAPIDRVNPCLVLQVKRAQLVKDTIEELQKKTSADLKKPLKVMFVGEDAVDEGGVRKEFFMLLLREVLDPKYGMFKYYDESRTLWFHSVTYEEPAQFQLLGVLCGLAIYNATIIDLHFPLALYKKLLNRPVSLDDLKELQPTVARSLEEVLKYEAEDVEDVFCLTFQISDEVYGELVHTDLVPDGATHPVTKSNRIEYVDAYIDYVFNKSVYQQFQAFYDGFHKVVGGRVLELFHARELQAMVVGNENYDWEELRKVAEYKGEFSAEHPTIKFFWEVFFELSLDDKKNFLRFLTGSDRIPIYGMGKMKFYLQPVKGGEAFLPVAHTCFNLLDLPVYTTKQTLQRKLLQAIAHSEGFGLV